MVGLNERLWFRAFSGVGRGVPVRWLQEFTVQGLRVPKP